MIIYVLKIVLSEDIGVFVKKHSNFKEYFICLSCICSLVMENSV